MMQNSRHLKNYFTTSDYNKITNNNQRCKDNRKKLVNESCFAEKIKRFATKAELKAEKDKK